MIAHLLISLAMGSAFAAAASQQAVAPAVKLHNGNTMKIVTDLPNRKGHWEIYDRAGKKLQTHDFTTDFLDRAKSVRAENLKSFDPKLNIVLVEMLPVLQVILFGDGNTLDVGPEIGPMSETKGVMAQKFDFSKLQSEKKITMVNVLMNHKESAYDAWIWNGKFFAAARENL